MPIQLRQLPPRLCIKDTRGSVHGSGCHAAIRRASSRLPRDQLVVAFEGHDLREDLPRPIYARTCRSPP